MYPLSRKIFRARTPLPRFNFFNFYPTAYFAGSALLRFFDNTPHCFLLDDMSNRPHCTLLLKYSVTCSKIVRVDNNTDADTVDDNVYENRFCKIKLKQLNVHANDLSLAINTIHHESKNNLDFVMPSTTTRTAEKTTPPSMLSKKVLEAMISKGINEDKCYL